MYQEEIVKLEREIKLVDDKRQLLINQRNNLNNDIFDSFVIYNESDAKLKALKKEQELYDYLNPKLFGLL